MQITNRTEADEAIKKLYRLQRDLASETIVLNDAIDKLKENSLAITAPYAAQYDALETELLEYIKTSKKEICADGKKSVELVYGTIGVNNAPAGLAQLKGYNAEETAKLFLKSPSFKHVVTVKYSYIKEAVKKLGLSAEKLARFGLRLTQTKDEPFFTFNEATLKEGM